MALEVRVYDEVTDIDPKVMWGLTFRQLIAAGAMVGVTALVVWRGASTGFVKDIPAWILGACAPFVLWAWTRPAGLRLERWLPHVTRAMLAPRRLLYVDDVIWKHQHKTRRSHVSRTARKEANQSEAGR
ncbi:PrgI family protein [Arachnia propionica]|uniref:PrgI family protein n=1 Tax=Arachnia propionica TaxID=1750 RepID=A0A3P1WV82_9ACTN|nr:PrgI family protein [Arachnia propionica]